MSTITNQTTEASLGTYFVRLFEVDADQFQLRAQKSAPIGTATASIVHTNLVI